jgi:NADPH-dependent glutamate synthase beta subunit-like oxidoreductase
MHQTSTNSVIVIGAGLSGLAAAHELAQRGIAVTVLESRDRIGEPWRARHSQLRLNIHRHFARLPGRKIPTTDGAFVRRDTVVNYLEGYADDLGVPIRFGVTVTGIQHDGSRWRVTAGEQIHECDHVIFATGRDRVAHIPGWKGRDHFAGNLIHAADLGDVAQLDNQRVLVIGAGNSGGDVLNHLARHNPAQVVVSVRHGPAIVPTRVLGFPLHRAANLFAALPVVLLDPAFRLMQWLCFGNLARHGLTSHPDGGGTRLLRDGIAFALDDGFVAAIKTGRFRVAGNIAEFRHDTVVFEDGHTFRPDTVICATGYHTGLEPLLGHLPVLDDRGVPLHPSGERDPAHEGLWFTGYRPVFQGYFHAACSSARQIADAIETQRDRRQ